MMLMVVNVACSCGNRPGYLLTGSTGLASRLTKGCAPVAVGRLRLPDALPLAHRRTSCHRCLRTAGSSQGERRGASGGSQLRSNSLYALPINGVSGDMSPRPHVWLSMSSVQLESLVLWFGPRGRQRQAWKRSSTDATWLEPQRRDCSLFWACRSWSQFESCGRGMLSQVAWMAVCRNSGCQLLGT